MLTVAPLVTKAIVNDVIGKQQLNLLLPYLGTLLGVMGLRATISWVNRYVTDKISCCWALTVK